MTAASLAAAERTCLACGAPVSTAFCTACGADAGGLRLPLAQPSAEVRRLVHRFNFGAALIPGFWAFAHRAPVIGVMYWLFFLPLPPVSIGIMVYLLFNGNRVALQRRRFRDAAEFAAVQRAWAISGFFILPAIVFALLVCLYIVALLLEALR